MLLVQSSRPPPLLLSSSPPFSSPLLLPSPLLPSSSSLLLTCAYVLSAGQAAGNVAVFSLASGSWNTLNGGIANADIRTVAVDGQTVRGRDGDREGEGGRGVEGTVEGRRPGGEAGKRVQGGREGGREQLRGGGQGRDGGESREGEMERQMEGGREQRVGRTKGASRSTAEGRRSTRTSSPVCIRLPPPLLIPSQASSASTAAAGPSSVRDSPPVSRSHLRRPRLGPAAWRVWLGQRGEALIPSAPLTAVKIVSVSNAVPPVTHTLGAVNDAARPSPWGVSALTLLLLLSALVKSH
eukprot:768731-Hanusia_phi.AAC.4